MTDIHGHLAAFADHKERMATELLRYWKERDGCEWTSELLTRALNEAEDAVAARELLRIMEKSNG